MAKVEWERTIEVGKIAFSGLFGDSLSFKKKERDTTGSSYTEFPNLMVSRGMC